MQSNGSCPLPQNGESSPDLDQVPPVNGACSSTNANGHDSKDGSSQLSGTDREVVRLAGQYLRSLGLQ